MSQHRDQGDETEAESTRYRTRVRNLENGHIIVVTRPADSPQSAAVDALHYAFRELRWRQTRTVGESVAVEP